MRIIRKDSVDTYIRLSEVECGQLFTLKGCDTLQMRTNGRNNKDKTNLKDLCISLETGYLTDVAITAKVILQPKTRVLLYLKDGN